MFLLYCCKQSMIVIRLYSSDGESTLPRLLHQLAVESEAPRKLERTDSAYLREFFLLASEARKSLHSQYRNFLTVLFCLQARLLVTDARLYELSGACLILAAHYNDKPMASTLA